MKITMYELLGMVKDGKTPKIKFNNSIYEYHDKEHGYCRYYHDNTYICLNTDYYLFDILNDEVEILEEKNRIPEKLDYCEENTFSKRQNGMTSEDRRLLDSNFKEIGNKINSIIDYLKSKGE